MDTTGFLSILAVWLIFFAILAYAIRVCVKDAVRRGKSPWLVTILVLLFFPLGCVIWLVFRPDPIDSGTDRPFRLEDHRVQ